MTFEKIVAGVVLIGVVASGVEPPGEDETASN